MLYRCSWPVPEAPTLAPRLHPADYIVGHTHTHGETGQRPECSPNAAAQRFSRCLQKPSCTCSSAIVCCGQRPAHHCPTFIFSKQGCQKSWVILCDAGVLGVYDVCYMLKTLYFYYHPNVLHWWIKLLKCFVAKCLILLKKTIFLVLWLFYAVGESDRPMPLYFIRTFCIKFIAL